MKQTELTDQAIEFSSYIYGLLASFPPEEEWNSVSKLRNAANDLLFYCAAAEGDPDQRAARFDWSNACRSASSLYALSRFAIKQKFVDFDPAVMVSMELFVKKLQKKQRTAKAFDDKQKEDEENAWIKRYKIWKETEL